MDDVTINAAALQAEHVSYIMGRVENPRVRSTSAGVGVRKELALLQRLQTIHVEDCRGDGDDHAQHGTH